MEGSTKPKRANVELARGIYAFSSNSQASLNGRVHPAAPRRVKSDSMAAADDKSSSSSKPYRKWYPAEDIPKPLASAKTKRNSKKVAKLRESITPGTVLILLSGRFRGKRVVFLRQMPSGTLLVTGPYKVNGVPLRRVNQAYVIATSTKVDLTGVVLPEVEDSMFEKPRRRKDKASLEQQFFESSAQTQVPDDRKKRQLAVDEAVMQKVSKEPYLRSYLNAKFTLTKNDRVHDMQF